CRRCSSQSEKLQRAGAEKKRRRGICVEYSGMIGGGERSEEMLAWTQRSTDHHFRDSEICPHRSIASILWNRLETSDRVFRPAGDQIRYTERMRRTDRVIGINVCQFLSRLQQSPWSGQNSDCWGREPVAIARQRDTQRVVRIREKNRVIVSNVQPTRTVSDTYMTRHACGKTSDYHHTHSKSRRPVVT